jgi:hypothetical protein
VSAGTYEIKFSVSGTEPNQMGIFINGASVAGKIYGSGDGTQQNLGQTILAVPAESVLTIVNHSSAEAITLATPIALQRDRLSFTRQVSAIARFSTRPGRSRGASS